MPWISEVSEHLTADRIDDLMRSTIREAKQRICSHPKRVLLLPPDITRMHSGTGRMTQVLYHLLESEADVHVIPTLGQHVPHTADQNRQMFGDIPFDRIHAHDWRDGCVPVGELSADVVQAEFSGAVDEPLPVDLNRMLMEEPWDLIINVGHVVPHEVLGFANHNKNYFIGLGGKETICRAHMLAATYGIENNLGQLLTPTRRCFNHAEEQFLGNLPDLYIQVVLSRDTAAALVPTGMHVGDDLDTYLAAARQSREENVTTLEKPLAKIVCVMQGDEFHSTWVANKAIYRTRMAMADGGELVILAPGLKRFGEQPEVDQIIRKYGYVNSERILELYQTEEAMQQFAHATAHLMHGTTEGRFTVIYAPGHLSAQEIEGVNYQFADLADMTAKYQPDRLSEGWNRTAEGEEFYFIQTPSAGLWATREKLYNRPSSVDGA